MTEHVIILAATPIGNLGDASRRLVDALENAEAVAAEDTRVAQRLLKGLGVDNRPRLIALHDHNERERSANLVEFAREGDLLVLSDAGMPTVSDPGYHLVTAAIEQGVEVTVIPGPSAVLTALAVSGLPTDRFTFEGFLPRKAGEKASALASLADERRTMVFFESPNRLAESLKAIAHAFGARRVAVCRELTKLHEEVRRGIAEELVEWAEGARGEIVIVVAGAPARVVDLETAVQEVLLLTATESLKDACASVAARTGLSRRTLYEAALRARA
jgi:16S rRNA (cytidine1402-2'-O)-methyltransferase